MLDLRELSSADTVIGGGWIIYRYASASFAQKFTSNTQMIFQMFNWKMIAIGEVIVWDLTNPETPLAISPIIEYSHKEPVQDLKW